MLTFMLNFIDIEHWRLLEIEMLPVESYRFAVPLIISNAFAY